MAEFNFLNNFDDDDDEENHLIPEFFKNNANNIDFYTEFCKNLIDDEKTPLFENIEYREILNNDEKTDPEEFLQTIDDNKITDNCSNVADSFFLNKEPNFSSSDNDNCWFFIKPIEQNTDIFNVSHFNERTTDYSTLFDQSTNKQANNLFCNKEMFFDNIRKPINKRKINNNLIDKLSKSIDDFKISSYDTDENKDPDQYNKINTNNNYYNVLYDNVPRNDYKIINPLENSISFNRNNKDNKTKRQKIYNWRKTGALDNEDIFTMENNSCDKFETKVLDDFRKSIKKINNNNSAAIDELLIQFDEIGINNKDKDIDNENQDVLFEYLDDNYNNSAKEILASPIILNHKDFIKFSERLSTDKQQLTCENKIKKMQNDNELTEPLCKPCQILQNYNQQKSESIQPSLSFETREKQEKTYKYDENNQEILYEKFCSLSSSKRKKLNPLINEADASFLMKKCSTPYKRVKVFPTTNKINQSRIKNTPNNANINTKITHGSDENNLSKSPPAISSQEIAKYQILLTQNMSGSKSPELFSQINNNFDEEFLKKTKNNSDMDLCESINLFSGQIDLNQNNTRYVDYKSPELFSPTSKEFLIATNSENIDKTNYACDKSFKNDTASLSVCDYAPYYCEAVLRQHQDTDYINTTHFNESLKYEYFTDDQYNDVTENRRKILITKIEVVILSLIRDIKNQNDLCLYIKKSTWDDCDLSTEKLPTKHFKNNIQLREINYYSRKSINKFPLIIHLLNEIYINLKNNIICTRRELYYKNLQFVKYQRTIDNALRDICLLLESPSWELRIFNTIKGLIAGPLILHTFNDEIINCMNFNGGCILPKDINIIKKMVTSAKYVIVVEKDTVFQKLLNKYFFNYLNNECIMITGKGYPDTITRLILQRLKNELNLPIYALMDADPHGIEIMFTYRYGSLSLHENITALAVPGIHWLGVYPSEINLLNLTRIKLTSIEMNKLKFMLKRPYITEKIRKEIDILINTKEKAEIESLSTELISYIARKIKNNLLL